MVSSFQFICIWSYESYENLKWNFLKFNNLEIFCAQAWSIIEQVLEMLDLLTYKLQLKDFTSYDKEIDILQIYSIYKNFSNYK